MARAVSVPRVSTYVAKLERLRRGLPIDTYLALLDSAAVTGFMPQLTPHGKPTGNYEQVKLVDRIAILKALVDKGMPNRPEPAPLPEDVETSHAKIDVSKLEDEELEALIQSAAVPKVGAPAEVMEEEPSGIAARRIDIAPADPQPGGSSPPGGFRVDSGGAGAPGDPAPEG